MEKIKSAFDTFLFKTAAERGWCIERVVLQEVTEEADPRDPSVKRRCGAMAFHFHDDCIIEVGKYMESFLRKEGQDLGIYQRSVVPLHFSGHMVFVTFFMDDQCSRRVLESLWSTKA